MCLCDRQGCRPSVKQIERERNLLGFSRARLRLVTHMLLDFQHTQGKPYSFNELTFVELSLGTQSLDSLDDYKQFSK